MSRSRPRGGGQRAPSDAGAFILGAVESFVFGTADNPALQVLLGGNGGRQVAVSDAPEHSFVIVVDATGAVYSCFGNEYGQLGLGDRKARTSFEQVFVPGPAVAKVACGSCHAAALNVDGQLFTWGRGSEGQLGHGDNVSQSKPKWVRAFKDKQVIDVACAEAYTVAVARDSDSEALEVFWWGTGEGAPPEPEDSDDSEEATSPVFFVKENRPAPVPNQGDIRAAMGSNAKVTADGGLVAVVCRAAAANGGGGGGSGGGSGGGRGSSTSGASGPGGAGPGSRRSDRTGAGGSMMQPPRRRRSVTQLQGVAFAASGSSSSSSPSPSTPQGSSRMFAGRSPYTPDGGGGGGGGGGGPSGGGRGASRAYVKTVTKALDLLGDGLPQPRRLIEARLGLGGDGSLVGRAGMDAAAAAAAGGGGGGGGKAGKLHGTRFPKDSTVIQRVLDGQAAELDTDLERLEEYEETLMEVKKHVAEALEQNEKGDVRVVGDVADLTLKGTIQGKLSLDGQQMLLTVTALEALLRLRTELNEAYEHQVREIQQSFEVGQMRFKLYQSHVDDLELLPSDEWGVDRLGQYIDLLSMSDRILHRLSKNAAKMEKATSKSGYLAPSVQASALLSELAAAHTTANRCVMWGLRSMLRQGEGAGGDGRGGGGGGSGALSVRTRSTVSKIVRLWNVLVKKDPEAPAGIALRHPSTAHAVLGELQVLRRGLAGDDDDDEDAEDGGRGGSGSSSAGRAGSAANEQVALVDMAMQAAQVLWLREQD